MSRMKVLTVLTFILEEDVRGSVRMCDGGFALEVDLDRVTGGGEDMLDSAGGLAHG